MRAGDKLMREVAVPSRRLRPAWRRRDDLVLSALVVMFLTVAAWCALVALQVIAEALKWLTR